jgi:hypothetical protein
MLEHRSCETADAAQEIREEREEREREREKEAAA